MGLAREPEHPVKLFAGVLAPEAGFAEVERVMEETWGRSDPAGAAFPFHYSRYYEEELGANLIRRYYAFERLIRQDDLAAYKIASNAMENAGSKEGFRRYNIDPGFVDLDKVVLATTKPATYRIYLGQGIYAQSTLYFKDGRYHPWPWTYRDYRDEQALEFFKKVRTILKRYLIK